MPIYPLTGPDGKEYDVEAPDLQQAIKDFAAYRQDQMAEQYQKKLTEAPPWTKMGMIGADVLRTAMNVPTLNYADKFADYMQGTGDQEQMKTEASRRALGWAAPAIEVGTAAATIPTVVPRAISAVGGGPAARAITGMLTGGAEGAILGGIGAAGGSREGAERNIASEGAWGGITGMLGQAAGTAVNKGKRMWDEFRGKSFEAPKYDIRLTPPKPTPQQQVNVAASQAESRGRLTSDPAVQQTKTRNKFEELQSSQPKKTFTPAQQKQMDLIIEGDPATKITGGLGDYLSNRLANATFGAGLAGGGQYAAAVLGPPAIMAAGRGLKEISAGGTREAVRDLRRMMYPNIEKFKPPTDAGDAAKFANALRQLGISLYD